MTVRFVWNADKAETNRRKHGVRFEEAALVFRDPLHLTVQDRIEGGEYRWQTIGQVYGAVILLVAHTFMDDDGPEPVDIVRIISARPATLRERKLYANG